MYVGGTGRCHFFTNLQNYGYGFGDLLVGRFGEILSEVFGNFHNLIQICIKYGKNLRIRTYNFTSQPD